MSTNNHKLANSLLKEPEVSLEEWDCALMQIQHDLTLEYDRKFIFKKNMRCRIYGLPLWPEIHRNNLPENDDLNRFLQITGRVQKFSFSSI